ncbi:MAG: radical SAM protein, partial [Bellilinea sp.]
DLQMDEQGIARRGLLVRHLVLPNRLAGSEKVLQFLAEEISKNVYLNLMDQYYPAYQAHHYAELNRPITSQEYQQAVAIARQLGLRRLDQRQRRVFWE